MRQKTLGVLLLAAALAVSNSVVSADGKLDNITVYFDRVNVKLNGQSMGLSEDSIIYNGSIYLPLREISEMLGAEVQWDSSNRAVTLDFLSGDDGKLFEEVQLSYYQYAVMQFNLTMRSMVEAVNADDYAALGQEIARFDELIELGYSMNDVQMVTMFRNLQTASKMIRTGLESKEFDDFLLARETFNEAATALRAHLTAQIDGLTN